MLELLEKLKSLAKQAGIQIDLMDIGITLTNAVNEEQLKDLASMIDYLEKHNPHQNKQDAAAYVLSNALHDLIGLKAVYLNDPMGIGFSPRSAGCAKKLAG